MVINFYVNFEKLQILRLWGSDIIQMAAILKPSKNLTGSTTYINQLCAIFHRVWPTHFPVKIETACFRSLSDV